MTLIWNTPLPPPATSQQQRLPPALEDGAFLADEMSFETLLVLASDIAAQLSFDGGDNAPLSSDRDDGAPQGNWQALFAKSEVTGMAIILSFDAALEQNRFRQAQSRGMDHTLAYLIALYANLDRWYRAFIPVQTDSADHIKLTIQTVLKAQLVRPFQYLVVLAQALDSYRPSLLADPRLQTLDPLWEFATTTAGLSPASSNSCCNSSCRAFNCWKSSYSSVFPPPSTPSASYRQTAATGCNRRCLTPITPRKSRCT
ncbi:hypothetical protein HAT93_01148 [Dickeya solani]|nr:hypothetical protein [Dickeya solani]